MTLCTDFNVNYKQKQISLLISDTKACKLAVEGLHVIGVCNRSRRAPCKLASRRGRRHLNTKTSVKAGQWLLIHI